MKVLSVNISNLRSVKINSQECLTGYFKMPVESIFLEELGVKDDSVADKVNHGGADKACYLFGFNHYNFWQQKYPDLKMDYGMFGENISVDQLNEEQLKIGDTFQIGQAVIQITQPRQPCFKMTLKFDDQIVKEFQMAHTPGIYVRVLKEGIVSKNDEMHLISSEENAPSVLNTYKLIYDLNPNKEELMRLIDNKFIASRLKKYLINKFKLN